LYEKIAANAVTIATTKAIIVIENESRFSFTGTSNDLIDSLSLEFFPLIIALQNLMDLAVYCCIWLLFATGVFGASASRVQ